MSTFREMKIRTSTRAGDVRIYWRRQFTEELRDLYSLNIYHQIVYIKNDGIYRVCT